MRICHFSDSHLGAGDSYARRGKSGLTERQEDIISGFIRSVDKIVELRPDVCIHAGDIFHRVRPLNSIMAIAVEQLHRLADIEGIPTIVIAGNHDAPKQPHVGAAIDVFRQIKNLHIVANNALEKIRIDDTTFFALPHCLTANDLKQELALCLPEPDMTNNVLIAHGVAAGMPEFSMADLGEQELPLDVLDRFDYVALGHFHNYCKVARTAWYAGSTERLSQSERDSAKGLLEVELKPLKIKFHEVESRAMVSLDHIDARGLRGDQVAEKIREKLDQIESSDKIVRVNVTGVTEETIKTMPSDVVSRLKEKAFALDIRFERDKSDAADIGFGRSAIGRLDEGFIEYLLTADLAGFDRELLKREALKYLSVE